MASTTDMAREILAGLAPEIPADEITLDADMVDGLRLDPLTIHALAFSLERALKISIPDARIAAARAINDLVRDEV